MTYVMREHPGWDAIGGAWLRAATTASGDVVLLNAAFPPHASPRMEVFAPPPLASSVPPRLAGALKRVGPVARWRSPSLWDAIATAIIRQVIRADQARLQHQRFRRAFGRAVDTPHGVVHALPTPDIVADLNPADFKKIGMAFKSTPLHNAAVAYGEHGTKWADLPPGRMAEELQTVPRIGPWTAGAAVADFTHDWSLYPYADLAVRTWAKAAAPDVAWPDTEAEFADRWRAMAAGQLGPLTLFTLAWGARHAGAATP
ncbi:MAG: hypothetical protein ACRD0P_32185 [Stackebrandtia sp.]